MSVSRCAPSVSKAATLVLCARKRSLSHSPHPSLLFNAISNMGPSLTPLLPSRVQMYCVAPEVRNELQLHVLLPDIDPVLREAIIKKCTPERILSRPDLWPLLNEIEKPFSVFLVQSLDLKDLLDLKKEELLTMRDLLEKQKKYLSRAAAHGVVAGYGLAGHVVLSISSMFSGLEERSSNESSFALPIPFTETKVSLSFHIDFQLFYELYNLWLAAPVSLSFMYTAAFGGSLLKLLSVVHRTMSHSDKTSVPLA